MRVMIIGGPRSGEWIDTLDGQMTYVDLRTADTYPINAVTWNETGGPEGPQSFRFPIAVHPSIASRPDGPQIAQNAVMQFAMSVMMREYGIRLVQPGEATAPATPAELFDAAGNPIGGGPRE